MRQLIVLASLLGGLAASLPAAAATFSPSGDPAGDEVRAAVRGLIRAAADGDVDAARRAFAGPASQAVLVDAWAESARSSIRLDASARARFGKDTPDRLLTVANGMRAGADVVMSLPVASSDTEAYVGSAGFDAPQYRLARTGGRWRVTAIEFRNPAYLAARARLLRTVAVAMDKFERRVAADEFRDAVALLRAFDRLGEELGPALLAADREGMDAPPVRPAGRVGPAERPAAVVALSGADLVAAVGKSAASPEARKLIAAMPGVPQVDVFDASMYLISEEAGMDVKFADATGRTITCVFVYPAADAEHHAYAGGLPGGLTAEMTRADVEARLGRPPSTIGSNGRLEAYYERHGLVVQYRGKHGRDPRATLARLDVSLPAATATDAGPLRVAIRATARPGTAEAAKADRVRVDGPDGEPLLVLPAEVAGAEDIVNAEFRSPRGPDGTDRPPYVRLDLTPAAAARLAAAYGPVPEGERPRVAVYINDTCFGALAFGRLADGVLLLNGVDPSATAHLAGVLHAAANQLPEGKPQTRPAP